MKRPRLPLLEKHDAALQTCAYCPKLCRAACPVGEVEASETLTPWGKMSMAWFVARGDVPLDAEHGEPAWACSACFACRERCDHKNEVAPALVDARAELFAAGAAPPEVREVVARTPERAIEIARAARALVRDDPPRAGAEIVLVAGCSYLIESPETAADARFVTAWVTGVPPSSVALAGRCCGLPLLHAGDRPGFLSAAQGLLADLGKARVIVADPGCARTLLVEYPRVGLTVPKTELLVDLLSAAGRRLPSLASPPAGPVRWHDPCQLGRGLGRYDEPRQVLARLLGAPPGEFLYNRELGGCSGAGGLLPASRPSTSRHIADARIAEHRERGGGLLVTGCGASLHRFRTRGEPAIDLMSLAARALRESG